MEMPITLSCHAGVYTGWNGTEGRRLTHLIPGAAEPQEVSKVKLLGGGEERHKVAAGQHKRNA